MALVLRITRGKQAVHMLDRLGDKYSEKRVGDLLSLNYHAANKVETPFVTGRLQRSARFRRLGGAVFEFGWTAPYARRVNYVGKSAGYAQRVQRLADRNFVRDFRRLTIDQRLR